MSDPFAIPAFPEFEVAQSYEVQSNPQLGPGLLIVGLLLLVRVEQRLSPELRELLMYALAVPEDGRPPLDELERYADVLEGESRDELRDAGAVLRRGVREFQQAVEAQDEYGFASACRSAVGAVEEVARQLAGDAKGNLRQAVARLGHAERIPDEARFWLDNLYALRNTRRGLGHGAGGCPEYVASAALSAASRGLEALIPYSALATAAGAGQGPSEQ